MIREVLDHPLLVARPPVLVDVGASTRPPRAWRAIASRAVCVAFDADDRETSYLEPLRKAYHTLHIVRAVVTDQPAETLAFYLTRFPECSSALEPDTARLANWAFSPLFEVVDRVQVRACRLVEELRRLDLDRVDWLKCDTQGTDLRILMSLPEPMRARLLMAELEPGVIDAYAGEDKLHATLAQMHASGFWLSDMNVKGSKWLAPAEAAKLSRAARYGLRDSAGWAELRYLNAMTDDNLDLRDHLLQWVFATTIRQHGFAAHTARRASERFGDPLAQRLYNRSVKHLKRGVWRAPVKLLRAWRHRWGGA